MYGKGSNTSVEAKIRQDSLRLPDDLFTVRFRLKVPSTQSGIFDTPGYNFVFWTQFDQGKVCGSFRKQQIQLLENFMLSAC